MANLNGGYYGYGGGKYLGGTFQFRSVIVGAYQFDILYRLGLQVAHISNADLHDFNPGEEEIFLTFSLPF
jgi:hypothetical protein